MADERKKTLPIQINLTMKLPDEFQSPQVELQADASSSLCICAPQAGGGSGGGCLCTGLAGSGSIHLVEKVRGG